MKAFLIPLLLLAALLPSQAQVIPCAHSHNDYLHDAPLYDALDQGFTSIEADVRLEGNNLKVSHGKLLLRFKKTLEEMYLDPLRERIAYNRGTVYPGDTSVLVIMVDLKGNGHKSYPALHQALSRYEDILTVYNGDSVKNGPVRICISGSKPFTLVNAKGKRYVTVDGNIDADVYSPLKPTVIERVSSPYSSFFRWKGTGNMPEAERKKLQELVANAHRYGRQIRFYRAGNNKKIWKELLDAGVDWINVDCLRKFRVFYTRYQAARKQPIQSLPTTP